MRGEAFRGPAIRPLEAKIPYCVHRPALNAEQEDLGEMGCSGESDESPEEDGQIWSSAAVYNAENVQTDTDFDQTDPCDIENLADDAVFEDEGEL